MAKKYEKMSAVGFLKQNIDKFVIRVFAIFCPFITKLQYQKGGKIDQFFFSEHKNKITPFLALYLECSRFSALSSLFGYSAKKVIFGKLIKKISSPFFEVPHYAKMM